MKLVNDIRYSDYPECILDIYLPECNEFSVFIYFHGGGFEEGDKTQGKIMAEYLVKHNVAVVSANYRMYPDAKYPDFIIDAAACVSWVYSNIKNYGICDKIYIGGSSAGGYLSQMLCFDGKYLGAHGLKPMDFAGFIHDAGQPTVHLNVLRERGLDRRRIIVDESSMLYHVGIADEYPPMLFIVSDNDMGNRYEQTLLAVSTMKEFNYKEPDLKIMHGGHCAYISKVDEKGDSILGKLVLEYIQKLEKGQV